MKPEQVVGLVLWRGGILLAVGYVAYWGLRSILSITDAQLEFSVAILLTGVVLLFASVVAEQIADARSNEVVDE